MALTIVLLIICILLFGYSFLRYQYLWQRGRIPNVYYYVFQALLLGALFICFFLSQYITNDYLLWGIQILSDIYVTVMLITPFFSFLRGIIRMIGKHRHWKNRFYRFFNHPTKVSKIVFVITIAIGIGVFAQSKIPCISENVITSDKKTDADEFTIAAVSDLNIGQNMAHQEISVFFSKLEQLHPDIVVFTGNLFSRHTTPSMREFTNQYLVKLVEQCPVYLIEGPNECRETEENIKSIQNLGVRLLWDEMIELTEGVQLVGLRNLSDNKRKDVKYTFSLVEKNKPAIVCSYEELTNQEKKIADCDMLLQASSNKNCWILPRQIQVTKIRFS